MKVTEKSFDEERAILIGMIVDKIVLARIAAKWEMGMFRSLWANEIGSWCIEYFQKYNKAPLANIQSIFEEWAGKRRNKNKVQLVETFLDGLNRQYRRLKRDSNSEYVIDIAGSYFNKVRLERMTEAIEGDILEGKVTHAVQRTINFHKLEMGVGSAIDVLEDKVNIQAAFEEHHDSLIDFKDGLGEFFQDRLERDGLVAFMGPDKRGKSFWLQDLAFRAVIQERRVAFFECGDLSRNQIMRRFMVRVARHPLSAGPVKYPVKIRLRKSRPPRIRFETRSFTKPLTWRRAYRACRRLVKDRHLSDRLRLSCHFNDTLRVEDIRTMLNDWERDGWIPDVVVIDYADILNMGSDEFEGRDRIDHTWKQLRRLSQEKHCLVLTATQSDAAAYDANLISRKHFSEDKRKLAHVTGMIGLNQSAAEKENGYMRLNWVVLREAWFSERRCCYVATCFPLANMSVRSTY